MCLCVYTAHVVLIICVYGFHRVSNVNESSIGSSSRGGEAARGADLVCDQLKVTLPPPPHYQSMRLCPVPHEEMGREREEEGQVRGSEKRQER